eukprot:scaffold1096_cov171-Pinguiococcus_pyrenoidosus.AAC.3
MDRDPLDAPDFITPQQNDGVVLHLVRKRVGLEIVHLHALLLQLSGPLQGTFLLDWEVERHPALLKALHDGWQAGVSHQIHSSLCKLRAALVERKEPGAAGGSPSTAKEDLRQQGSSISAWQPATGNRLQELTEP